MKRSTRGAQGAILFFLAILGISCGGDVQQSLSLKAAGLWRTANELDAPPGALSVANNAVIRRPGVAEARRGQKPDTDTGASVRELAAFEGSVLAHGADGVLRLRVAEDSYSALPGTYTAPTGHPMRFTEASGGLYFTTNAGPYRMDSPTSTPVPAGVPPGLEGKAETTGSTGWLANGSTVGYRFVWGVRDEDGQLLIGAPSGRVTVTNAAGAGRNVLLTSPIPTGITTSHFLQVYRTVIIATGGADPGEDMAQVAEVFPTAAQIAAGSLSTVDIASFANGAAGYFSPNIGAGLADSKQQPPLLTDAIKFEGYTFGVVTSYRQTLGVSLLGVGGTSGGLRDDEGIWFTDGTTDEIYLGDPNPLNEGARPTATKTYFYLDSTSPTPSERLENSVRSLARTINGRSALIHATYASGPSDLPGKMVATAINLDVATLEAKAWRNAAAWTPALVQEFEGTPTRAAGTVTVLTAANYHHLSSGQTIELLTGSADFPAGTKTITVTGDDTFTYVESGANVVGPEFQWRTTGGPQTFVQEATGGSWAHSAFEEPDSWPPRFRYQIGGPSTVLYRITAQGEALLFWTSDGLYRLTGSTEDDFTLRPLDPTARLVGESTPVSMGNRAFGLTTQGVVSVTELGVEKISTPVDVDLLPYYGSTAAARALTDASAFGVSYQSENEYMLFLPNVNGSPGDPATQAYVYNTQTGTWVRHTWEWEDINEDSGYVRSGLVNPADDFLYLGAGNWLTRERKARALTDYQDADGVGVPFDIAYQVQTASNPAAYKQWVETTLLLERPQPASVFLYLLTEIDSNEEGGTITSKGNTAVRTYIPRNKSRSARLTVGMRHSTALEKAAVLGLSVSFNVASTKVGR